jgi:vitamin K-dependent gamma-carboxylase
MIKWFKEYQKKLNSRFSEQVDVLPLLLFRVMFGMMVSYQGKLLLSDSDSFDNHFGPRTIYFNFIDFIKPLNLDLMRILVMILIGSGIGIALGLFYRLSSVISFLILAYFLICSEMYYQNHYYLMVLLSLLCVFIPLNESYSIDLKIKHKDPPKTLPYVYLWILQFQIAVVYFFGGLAKINPDWLKAYPMRIWIEKLGTLSYLGDLQYSSSFAYLLSYGGIFFDLGIIPAFFFRKTQKFALVVLLLFHAFNYKMFNIGLFPFLAFGSTVCLFLNWRRVLEKPKKIQKNYTLLWLYVAIQVLLPLRAYLYSGFPRLTGMGQNFAWRMRLNDVNAHIQFVAINPKNHKTIEFSKETDKFYLTPNQYTFVSDNPSDILKTAKMMAEDCEKTTGVYPEVYVKGTKSLDGRKAEPFINSLVNLTKEDYHFFTPYSWIIPPKEELKF